MELRQLRYFQAVAETLSFSRAAERLRVAQPALSRQIRSLEQELGLTLFVRSTVRVRLTDAGQAFRLEVTRILRELEGAVAQAQSIAQGARGAINVGTDWRLPMPELLMAVREFRAENPNVTVNLVDLPMHEQIAALRDGRIHVGIVPPGQLGAHEDLELLRLSTAELHAALPATHRLAPEPRVRLRDLKDDTWLLIDESSIPGFRAQLTQICRLAQFTPHVGLSVSSLDSLLAHVAAGDGIGLIPSSLIPKTKQELLSFPGTDCAPLELYATWLHESAGPLVPRFLQVLRSKVGGAPVRT